MTCDTIRNSLLLAESGEASAADTRLAARHLASCAACRSFQADQARLVALARDRGIRPPRLNVATLTARAGRRTSPARFTWLPLAAAALLAIAAGATWLAGALRNPGEGLPRSAMLNEWQFWLVATVGPSSDPGMEAGFQSDWNERDFAHHLLVLEGLMPEEGFIGEEELPDPASGALPPISLRDYSIPGPLRS